MNRRQFLTIGVAIPVALVAAPVVIGAQRHYDLDELVNELQHLPWGALHNNGGEWNVSQVLQHCAQSIQYSLQGYPQMFSTAFQYTAGTAAATVFRALGSMRHNLNEEIPGGYRLEENLSVGAALHQLVSSIHDFQYFDGQLQPHFAYGALDKEAYTAAHWLHIRNHLNAFVALESADETEQEPV